MILWCKRRKWYLISQRLWKHLLGIFKQWYMLVSFNRWLCVQLPKCVTFVQADSLKVLMCRCMCVRQRNHINVLSEVEQDRTCLPGCWAGLRLRGLNREGTKAREPEGGGEWMSRWDDNAAWHLWNESLVTMAKKKKEEEEKMGQSLRSLK